MKIQNLYITPISYSESVPPALVQMKVTTGALEGPKHFLNGFVGRGHRQLLSSYPS